MPSWDRASLHTPVLRWTHQRVPRQCKSRSRRSRKVRLSVSSSGPALKRSVLTAIPVFGELRQRCLALGADHFCVADHPGVSQNCNSKSRSGQIRPDGAETFCRRATHAFYDERSIISCLLNRTNGPKYASKVPSKVRRAVKQRMIVEGIGFCEPAGVVVFSTFLLSSRGSSSIFEQRRRERLVGFRGIR
jgi:hypothetical protein